MIRTGALFLTLLAAPSQSFAGETPCWMDGGVVVAPASVAGIAGDYILDTGQARTEIHETRAQANGIDGGSITGSVLLAGVRLENRTATVADHDARTAELPTPVAGVIGADVLKDFVVDVRFAPCRIRLSRPGEAPRFRAGQSLPLEWEAGQPVVRAAVADGPTTLVGPFAPSTGLAAAVRLPAERVSRPAVGDKAQAGQLRALSFAGRLHENVAADVAPGAAAGAIGAPVLSRTAVRFDFSGRRLILGR